MKNCDSAVRQGGQRGTGQQRSVQSNAHVCVWRTSAVHKRGAQAQGTDQLLLLLGALVLGDGVDLALGGGDEERVGHGRHGSALRGVEVHGGDHEADLEVGVDQSGAGGLVVRGHVLHHPSAILLVAHDSGVGDGASLQNTRWATQQGRVSELRCNCSAMAACW